MSEINGNNMIIEMGEKSVIFFLSGVLSLLLYLHGPSVSIEG